MSTNEPVFLIFEGGGAKGIAHLGALRAVEELRYPVVGVAGASAGAFLAALVAIGYNSDELLNISLPESNLLALKGLTPIELLGADSWAELSRVMRAGRRLSIGTFIAGIWGAGIASPRSIPTLWRFYRQRGLFTTTKVRDFVNDCMRERLQACWSDAGKNPDLVPKHVCFGDLNYGAFPSLRPLKIIATDVDSGVGVLFDRANTPNVLVGDAVAASIAIPGFFQPARIRERDPANSNVLNELPSRFADGGLVSNLPSWVFNDERLALQRRTPKSKPTPILAITLVDPDPAVHRGTGRAASEEKADGTISWFGKLERAAIFGSQAVTEKLLVDLDVIKIPTALSVLEFDASWDKIREAFLAGRNHAKSQIRMKLEIKPREIHDALSQVLSNVGAEITKSRVVAGLTEPHLRACRIVPYGQMSLRVSHGVNMDLDADDRLLLDRDEGLGAALAMRTRDVAIWPISLTPATPMSKYEAAHLRRGLKTGLYVPIFRDISDWAKAPGARNLPLGVLGIDSDDDLMIEFQTQMVRESAVVASARLAATFY